MHIAKIEISTKKGHSQLTRWHVAQSRPYPDMERGEWRNAGGLLPRYGSKEPANIGTEYRCFLLRSDFAPETATGNRTDFAGFSPGLVYDGHGNRVMQPENPGCIEIRGKSLGEMCITFGSNPDWPDIQVRGYGNPATSAERDWIRENIIPGLRAFIADNVQALKAEAVEALKSDVAKRLAGWRSDLDRMEKQMNEAIASL